MSKTKEVPSLTRGQRNNNPGNIRWNKSNRWLGLIGHDKMKFCKFSSMEYGFRALVILLLRYLDYGYNTPRKIILRYAPLSENDSYAYIRFICNRSGLSDDQVILAKSPAFYDLVSAIVFYESHVDLTGSIIKTIYDSFRRDS